MKINLSDGKYVAFDLIHAEDYGTVSVMSLKEVFVKYGFLFSFKDVTVMMTETRDECGEKTVDVQLYCPRLGIEVHNENVKEAFEDFVYLLDVKLDLLSEDEKRRQALGRRDEDLEKFFSSFVLKDGTPFVQPTWRS